MKYVLKTRTSGYSLLEVLVYLSILAVMTIFVVDSTLSIYRAFLNIRVERQLSINGDVVIETVVRSIRAATSTDVASSVFGTNPGVLRLGAKTFSLSGETLQMLEGGGPAKKLTSGVRVRSLVFYRSLATTTNSELIKIELGLEGGTGVFMKSKNFFASSVLRGTY